MMTTADKLKKAIENVEGAKYLGYYEGRFFFKGIAITLERDGDFPELISALRKERAFDLLKAKPHFDDLERERLVAWNLHLFKNLTDLDKYPNGENEDSYWED